MALIAIPVVVRTTENMLRLVPGSLREAAYALGTPKWKVAFMVTLRAAQSGIMTGILLALARVSGETAPLLFTALSNQFFSTDMNKPMANLPVVIFQFAMSPYDNWVSLAWGGSLLITFTVVLAIILPWFLNPGYLFFTDFVIGPNINLNWTNSWFLIDLILKALSFIFPLEILPVVSFGAALFHALISLVVWLVAYCIFFGAPNLTVLLAPLVILRQVYGY